MCAKKKLVEEWLPLPELTRDAEAEQSFGKTGIKLYKEACLRFGQKRKKL